MLAIKQINHVDVMPSFDVAKRYLEGLDLNYLVSVMTSANYPLPRWTHEDASHCIQLYKNFLLLFKMYPNETLVPTREIDECWHNHILYTKQYHNDCSHIFGYYLHHEPASIENNDYHQTLIMHFLKTKQLYLEAFQRPMHAIQS